MKALQVWYFPQMGKWNNVPKQIVSSSSAKKPDPRKDSKAIVYEHRGKQRVAPSENVEIGSF